jgi:hypothetical protein
MIYLVHSSLGSASAGDFLRPIEDHAIAVGWINANTARAGFLDLH